MRLPPLGEQEVRARPCGDTCSRDRAVPAPPEPLTLRVAGRECSFALEPGAAERNFPAASVLPRETRLKLADAVVDLGLLRASAGVEMVLRERAHEGSRVE
jgi:hypothetical protein